MTLNINNLVLEITRRCNAGCRHCLRGDAQPADITRGVIDKVLEDVSYIGAVTFTGGEPTLAVKAIRYFTLRLKARHIGLGSFFLYTNGKLASEALVHALLDLYGYCDDNEVTGLAVSTDQFHREQIPDVGAADRLYSALSFYRPRHRDELGRPSGLLQNMSDEAIFDEGRAHENGLGARSPREADPCRVESGFNGHLEVSGDLYINVFGDVVPSCDWSYERQAEGKTGNVMEKGLYGILKPLDVNPGDLIETLTKEVA